jgi:hypothetical protein
MLLLLLTGCPKGLGSSGLQTSIYAFQLDARFSTQAVEDGQPAPLLVQAGTGELHLRGELRRTPTRTFRDGSRGWMVRFEDVEQAASLDGPWIEAGLSGRSVELRTFSSGEILAIRDVEHVAGPGRYGDVVDVLFPALSPVVPDLEPGDQAWRRSAWPLVIGSKRAWQNALVATWTHQGREAGQVLLSYAGGLEGKGQDARVDARLTQSGTASGEMRLRAADLRLLQHELDWTRVVQVDYGERLQLTQTQDFDGVLELIGEEPGPTLAVRGGPPTAEDDAAPTGRYLSSAEVHGMLLEQLPQVGACYDNSSEARARTELGEVYVNWRIAPDGSVRDAHVHESRSGLPALDACLVEQVGQLRFRAHDEAPIDIGFPFVYREAALQPYPMVFVKDRSLHPLFVWLDDDGQAAARLGSSPIPG